MTAEEFIPKSEIGKYSRNQIVQWAERYHQYKLEELRLSDVSNTSLICKRCQGAKIVLRT
jgi:hypothetical protein